MGESAGVAVAVGEGKVNSQQNKLRTQNIGDHGENESSLTLAGFKSRESSKSIAERIMRIKSAHQIH